MSATPTLDWIAAEARPDGLRLWLMSSEDKVIETRRAGIGPLEDSLGALLADLGDGPPLPVICCGRAEGQSGSPYVPVPATPPTLAQAQRRISGRFAITLLPGLSQSQPVDVLHGDVARITGFLAGAPKFDGVLLLTGLHSRWVHLSAGEVVSFRSFMTGELFDLISTRSVLRGAFETSNWDDDAFDAAVSDMLSRPAELAARLLALDAKLRLGQTDPGTLRAGLSGLLIGAEIAAAKPYWLGQRLAALGPDELTAHYARALAPQGATVTTGAADAAALAGLTSYRVEMRRSGM